MWVCLFVTLDLRIIWWRVLWFWVDHWVCYIDVWDDHAHVVGSVAGQLAAKVGRCTCNAHLQEAEDEQQTRNGHPRGLEPEWTRRT